MSFSDPVASAKDKERLAFASKCVAIEEAVNQVTQDEPHKLISVGSSGSELIPQAMKDRFRVVEYKPEARSKWPGSMCVNCGKSCEFRCTRCKLSFYCSKQCQSEVAKVHNRTCIRIPEEPLLYWQVKYPKQWTNLYRMLLIADPKSRPQWAFLQEMRMEDGKLEVAASLAGKSEAGFRFDVLMGSLLDKSKLKKAMHKVYAQPQQIGFVVESLHDKYSVCVVICGWEDCRTPRETIDIAKNNKTVKTILNRASKHACTDRNCDGCQKKKKDRENAEKEQKREIERIVELTGHDTPGS